MNVYVMEKKDVKRKEIKKEDVKRKEIIVTTTSS